MNILIVEDEAIVALDIAQKLEAQGYTVDAIADSGEEALLQAHSRLPDLVVMDINLKGKMDGIQTAALLRKIAPTPVIYLTALTDRSIIERARDTEPEAYLVKPFKDADLNIAIELALHKAARNNAANLTGELLFYPVADRLFVRAGNGFDKVLCDNVLYLEAARAYCVLHTNMRKYTLATSMAEVLRAWAYKDMVRIHKSYAVNLKNVSRVEDNHVHIGSISLPLGAHYKETFIHSITLI